MTEGVASAKGIESILSTMFNVTINSNTAEYHTNSSNNGSLTRIVLAYPSLVLWFTVTMMICIAGTILSGCIILAFLVRKSLLRGSNILIGYLLCLDLLNAGVFLPTTFIILLLSQLGGQFNADKICQISVFVTMLLNCISTWTGAFISINRFIAMFLPHKYEMWIKPKILASMICISCIFGLGVAIPPLMGIGGFFGRFYPMGNCALSSKGDRVASIYIALGSTVPTVIQGVLYFSLAVHMACGRQLSKYGLRAVSRTRDNIAQKRRRNVGRMLIVSYIWYLICFVPVPTILTYYPAVFKMPNAFIWLKTVQVSGFAGTPFIFLLLGEEYREAVRGLFRKNGQVQPFTQQVQSGVELPLYAFRTMEAK